VWHEGTLQIPRSIANKLPGVVSLRMSLLNANGKAYIVDRAYRIGSVSVRLLALDTTGRVRKHRVGG